MLPLSSTNGHLLKQCDFFYFRSSFIFTETPWSVRICIWIATFIVIPRFYDLFRSIRSINFWINVLPYGASIVHVGRCLWSTVCEPYNTTWNTIFCCVTYKLHWDFLLVMIKIIKFSYPGGKQDSLFYLCIQYNFALENRYGYSRRNNLLLLFCWLRL